MAQFEIRVVQPKAPTMRLSVPYMPGTKVFVIAEHFETTGHRPQELLFNSEDALAMRENATKELEEVNKHAWERIHALQKEVDRLLNERIENLELVNDRQRYRYAVKALSDYCRSRTLVSAKKIGLIIDEYLEEDDLYAET